MSLLDYSIDISKKTFSHEYVYANRQNKNKRVMFFLKSEDIKEQLQEARRNNRDVADTIAADPKKTSRARKMGCSPSYMLPTLMPN